MRGNRVKEKLKAGQAVHVVAGHSYTSDTIDFMGPLGFDGFWIEGEHGSISFDRVGDVSRACDLWNMTSIMRIHANEPGLIGRTLDLGVSGLVVPHVSTREAAEQVARASRFAPEGMRGIYGGRRSYGVDDFFKKANDGLLVVVLIEEIEAVRNLDAILSVDHIDVFFVAPGDLAQTMGYVGQMYHPEVQKVVSETLRRIVAAGRTAGALAYDTTQEEHLDIGVRFFLASYDHWIRTGAYAYLDKVRKMEKERQA
jgi:4-hydroxy-2-oxoheptanedioate aldolase